jgi:hypothetical protein
MRKKKENLSGSYSDNEVTIIGNETNAKPRNKLKLRDLDSIPFHEVQDKVEKLRRKKEMNILVRKEQNRQCELEHPTLAKAIPYLQVVGVIVGLLIFFMALWLISQVNTPYDNSVNPNLTQMILTRLAK